MKKLKFISTVLSATTLMSMFTTIPTMAVDENSSESSQIQTTDDLNTDDEFIGATGDLSLENSDIPDDAIIIESADDYYALKGNSQKLLRSSASVSLPDSVDNSQSKYFPEIGSQGGLGSCVAWSQVYYQFTYTMNKEMGVETTSENAFSPKFVYNSVNGAKNDGTSAESAYKFMTYQGNVPISMVPYDDDYLSWSPTEEVWRTSIKYRLKGYQYFDDIGGEDTQITSADDSDLEAIKTALSNGDVLSFSTHVTSFVKETLKTNSNAPENSNYAGESVVVRKSGSDGSHRMTLVGYNDNIWTDINENGKVDQGEMGAFKIANSWGKSYGNSGFIWVAYDAMNNVSSVEGAPEDSKRLSLMSLITRIDVMPYNTGGDYYLKYTWNSSNRNSTKAEVTAELNGTEYTASVYTQFIGVGRGEYSYDGTTEANDGTMVLALDNVLPDINSELIKACNWSVTFYDTIEDGSVLTVKDAEIVDESENKVYKPENVYPFTLDGDQKTVKCADSNLSNTVIYYRGYEEPQLHYKVNNGLWTDVSMDYNIERRGYLYKYVIELAKPSDVTLYFSDSKGNVDNNSGKYYTADTGLNYYVTENVAEPLVAEITLNDDAISTGKRMSFSALATGGYEPYQYQFIYKNLDTGDQTAKDYTDRSEFGQWFTTEGNYRISVNVMDYSDNVATASVDLYVEEKSFEYTEFTMTPTQKIMAGDTLKFNAVTNYENIIYIGYPKNTHEFTVKNSAGTVVYTASVRTENCSLNTKSSVLTLDWVPSTGGSYTITVSSTDGDNEYAEKTLSFDVAEFNGTIIGDTDNNGVVSIVDATLIQKYCAGQIGDFDIWKKLADSDKNDYINIKDATYIQLYLASDRSDVYVGTVNYKEPEPITEPTTAQPTTVAPTTVQPTTVSKTNTVVFTNSLNWSGTISCYYWSDSNTSMTSWPGKAMTYTETNSYGQKQYSFEVPDGATYVIFTNGSSQTVDISYPGGEVRYYALSTTDSKGHYNVETW